MKEAGTTVKKMIVMVKRKIEVETQDFNQE